MKFKRFLAVTQEKTFLNELSLTLLRVCFGLALALAHGLSKLPPSDRFVAGVDAIGFPVPSFFAWCAGLAEFLGGLLLAAGLFTRPAAFFIAFNMAVAAFGRHAADPFNDKELALVYLLIALVYLCRGAGKYSLDRLLFK